jgi:PAS domain S-box-containing protein
LAGAYGDDAWQPETISANGRDTAPNWNRWDQVFTKYGTHAAARGLDFAESCAALFAQRKQALADLMGGDAAEIRSKRDALLVLSDVLDHGTALIAKASLEHVNATARSREEDLATTLDSIGDAVVVTDAQGCVVRMNPIAERLTGYALDECKGRPLDAIFRIENETTGASVENPVHRVLAEGLVVGLANHTVLVARDGTKRPIADSGAPVRREGGEVRGVVLVFRDVSEERRAERALQHWERIFQHATWGVAVASASDVTLRAVNPAYASMHGYTVEELTGAPISTLWGPQTRADMERHAHETHHHGRLVAETLHLCKDGSLLPVEIVATTIKDAQGEVEWFVANVQDITERKRLQASRLRALELESENRRVEEANRLKSEFLASMSHELRTPLNSIIGFAELLHDDHVGVMSPKQKEFLHEILSGGRHLLRLINDVLDLAKVEAGKIELRPEPTDLEEVTQVVVNGLRATIRDRDLRLEVAVSPELGEVIIDPGRFKQILYNYVSNALKFTPDGGRVLVRVVPFGEHFRLEVEDTGIGISDEDAKRLFVAFQQVDSAATKRQGGTGLGLALTKRLVEAQGGSVGMRQREGGGTVFFAILPRRPVGYAVPEARPDLTALGTILVVDADPEHRAALVTMLAEAGYRVEAAATAQDATHTWQKHPYAALVLDLLDGGSDEHQKLLEVVRTGERPSNVPVIALSIVGSNDAVAGFAVTDVLSKPVQKEVLLQALERSAVAPLQGRPIVVIDDDPGSLKLMAATLAQIGYNCVCFEDARGALVALRHLVPAAIILDLIMPEMDGLAFLDKFRAAPDNRTIPVMVWTVKDLSTDERERLQATVSSIVQKGIQDGSRLAVALQSFLGSSGATEAVA